MGVEKIVSGNDYKINKQATVYVPLNPVRGDVAGGPETDAVSPRVNDDRWPAASGTIVQ